MMLSLRIVLILSVVKLKYGNKNLTLNDIRKHVICDFNRNEICLCQIDFFYLNTFFLRGAIELLDRC